MKPEAQDIAHGTIVGFNVRRTAGPAGPTHEVTTIVVKLLDGTDVEVEFFPGIEAKLNDAFSFLLGEVAKISLPTATGPGQLLSLGAG